MSGASGDEVLVRLAVGGDRAAFGALVTPHVTDLTRLCRRVAGPALADDCVQDTLLLALLRLQSLRDRIDVIGGAMEIISEPGRGTTVRGHVTVASEMEAQPAGL